MTQPMSIRARLKGDICDVRVRVPHPNETGNRKGADGKLIPAHYIQTITVSLNGRVVVAGQTGIAISANPMFGYKLKGAKKGDKVSVTWKDNKGETRTNEAVVG